MKIISLRLRNFKGVRDFTLEANGANVNIYGNNAAGKTTIFDAFTWLLFDKDSQGKKDFEIKTLDADNNPIHNLEHEVEGVFEVGGKKLTLRKVYAEKWTKKRGSATAEFTGHTTDHYIDGVPKSKGEYAAKIAEIMDEGIFKLLTSPTYFNEQLHWQERRKTLLEVCGDISDEEVIASDKALARLPVVLQGRNLDDHRKVIAADTKRINDELKRIPDRIDEQTRTLPEVTDDAEIGTKLLYARTALRQKQEALTRIQSGGEIAQVKRKIAELETDLIRLRNEARSGVDKKVNELRETQSRVHNYGVELGGKVKTMEVTIDANNKRIGDLRTRLASLEEAWQETDDRVFTFEQSDTCPTCGQALPQSQLHEARVKAQEQFNLDKARRLEELDKEGEAAAGEVERLLEENKALAKELDEARASLNKAREEYAKIQQEITALQSDVRPATPAETDKQREIDALKGTLLKLQEGDREAIGKVHDEIDAIQAEITALEKAQANIDAYNRGRERIKELQAQEKQLAKEYERLQGELYLCEQFVRAKVALLTDKINSRFKFARFKLFEEQINGGIAECCETLYGGVPYSGGLNNGHKIIVGLDIINTLSEFYGFNAPIFIDNRESVTELPECNGQIISLIVSKPDNKLRVEVN